MLNSYHVSFHGKRSLLHTHRRNRARQTQMKHVYEIGICLLTDGRTTRHEAARDAGSPLYLLSFLPSPANISVFLAL